MSESLSKSLQYEDISLQEGLSAVSACKRFYERQQNDEAFNRFYDKVIKLGKDLKLDPPTFPCYQRIPARIDSGSQLFKHSTPKQYFHQLYYQACDLLVQELNERFDQRSQ